MKVARVVIDSSVKELIDFYEYLIGDEIINSLTVGMRVEVPFGKYNAHQVGYVIKIYEGEPQVKLKKIIKVLDEVPLINRERLVEAFWVKNMFFSTFSEAIRLFLPFGANITFEEQIVLKASLDDVYAWAKGNSEKGKMADVLSGLGGKTTYSYIKEAVGVHARTMVNELYEKELIDIFHTDRTLAKEKKCKIVRLVDLDYENKIPAKSAAQLRAARFLTSCDFISLADLCLFAGVSRSSVNALYQKGIVEFDEVEVFRNPNKKRTATEKEKINLTEEQKNAVSEILKTAGGKFKPTLLHGVTGSGKTEVYFGVIDNILKAGGSVIVLFPEIALTGQMIDRFFARFGEKLAVIHSALSAGERYDEWRRIESGRARVVIGARSAVFAPCKNLKLIVIDEEHEGTYKSETGVRYNATDVAAYRAQAENAALLLGSATPSVDSYYKAESGEYNLIELTKRNNNATLPKVIIADMRQEIEEGNKSPFSRVLHAEIEKNINSGEQSILFLNRRGHSTFVSCRSCGYVAKCPSCNISLNYHSFGDNLVCHYCGYKKKKYTVCPECGSKYIFGFGTGTQKIEEKISEQFNTASVIRMDNDTTRKKEAHEKILKRFKDENISILLGTQMIAKGLDFKNVTLVGVLAADQVLNMGDFRANERTFSLITQVCGRAGRGTKKGRAVLQTYMPDNPVIKAASKHDYKAFYEDEILFRKALNYPPFCDIINIIVTGPVEREVITKTQHLQKITEQALLREDVKVYAASPCQVDKVKNSYRWHFWIKCQYNNKIAAIVNKIVKTEKKLSVIADLNPNII